MTTKTKNNHITFITFIIFMALLLIFSFPITKLNTSANAESSFLSENVTITNSDFSSSSSTALQSTPNGWSKKLTNKSKSGIINIKESNFSSRYSSYALTTTQNPGKPYTIQSNPLDDYILMLNAKSSNTTNEKNKQAYTSNSINLDAYSYYKISIWAFTQGNSFASIYISGLESDITDTYEEKFTNTTWTEHIFYIETGIDSESINIELWLGTNQLESYDAVFFDHITMKKVSENYYGKDLETIGTNPSIHNITTKQPNSNLLSNGDFELGTKENWSVINYLPKDGDCSVMNIKTNEAMQSVGINPIGGDFSYNNTYALVMYSKDGSYFGYESTSFIINPYEMYKISLNIKVSDFVGSAKIELKENDDVKNFYGEDYSSYYTPMSASLNISTTNSKDTLKNNYTTYSFYVRGHELYTTSLKLQILFGEENNKATGAIAIDNIVFEKITSDKFENSATSNSQKLTLTTLTETPSVTNGAFNLCEDIDIESSYPFSPTSWSHDTNDESKSIYGIINTNNDIYESNKHLFGNIINPQNPDSTAISVDKDVNNVLMLWNKYDTYQSVTSDIISSTANSYQKITFDYKTVQQTANNDLLNVYILDNEDNVIFADENLSSSDWTKYTIIIKSGTHSATLKLKISLGTNDNQTTGYAYIDNVRFFTDTSMTDIKYSTYANSYNTIDFQTGSFNLISDNQINGIYTPYRYITSLDKGTPTTSGNPIACGGIINGEDNIFGITNSQDNTNSLKYMPIIRVNGEACYSLTGKDTFTLTSGSYYKFSVSVLTKFYGNTLQANVEEKDKAKFGAMFELSGLTTLFSELKTDGEWKTYSFYINANEDKTINLKFALESESNEINGFAFFDNFKFETIEEAEYTNAELSQENDSTALAFKVSEAVEEDENETKNNNNNNNANLATTLMYLIPTLILAVALILALVAYFMKKIKIKKWEKKKVSDYDRDKTVHRDVVRVEAEQQRDADIEKAKQDIAEVEKEIARIEEINKQRIKDNRTSAVTKQTEREFKAYANKRTRLVNTVEAIKVKIENMKTPEYLLAIQKKIVINKVKLEKQAKQNNSKVSK